MMVRIIDGKLDPGTLESNERTYKEVVKAGKILGLNGGWLLLCRTAETMRTRQE